MLEYSSQRWFLFQSTLPLRRATLACCLMVLSDVFQSTLPLRGATGQVQRASANGREHISIHTPLAGSDLETGFVILRILISIHTPLAGSDSSSLPTRSPTTNFNPHSPCGERPLACCLMVLSDVFQSTLPLRGATGQVQRASANGREHISIHTPLAGSDLETGFVILRILISIHTPLAGSDSSSLPTRSPTTNFNPHSPCGERPLACCLMVLSDVFQSTLPLRGATYSCTRRNARSTFQSTLPLRGATSTSAR